MPIRPEMKPRYPADWKLRSRFVRVYRSRGRCEWCKVADGSVILPLRCCREPVITDQDPGRCDTCGKPVPRVVLTAAHVHDKRPEVASLLNLAALCQRCHLEHDRVDARRDRIERLDRINGQGMLFE